MNLEINSHLFLTGVNTFKVKFKKGWVNLEAYCVVFYENAIQLCIVPEQQQKNPSGYYYVYVATNKNFHADVEKYLNCKVIKYDAPHQLAVSFCRQHEILVG